MNLTEQYYYPDITDLKELHSIEDANLHIKSDWVLLKVCENHIDSDTEKGILHRSTIVYIVGLPKGVTPRSPEDKPQSNSPSTPGQLYDQVKAALGEDFDDRIHIENYGKRVRRDYTNDRDAWKRVNDKLKTLGFTWFSAGKDSHWEKVK